MTEHPAPSSANDDVRPLDEAVIGVMRETTLASPNPIDTAILLFAAAVGGLRGTIGNEHATAVLLHFAAEVDARG